MSRRPIPIALIVIVTLLAACRPAVLLVDEPTPTPVTLFVTDTPAQETATPPTEASASDNAPWVVRREPGAKVLTTRRPTIKIVFGRSMNPESVAAALRIEPDVPLNLSWEGETLHIAPVQPFEPEMAYTFTLANTAKSVDGYGLEKPYAFTYQLKSVLAELRHPTIQNPSAPLALHFNYSMDTASVERALLVQPALPSAFQWNDSATRITITPATPLIPSLEYRVSFAGGLRDANGDDLPTPDPRAFVAPPAIHRVEPRHNSIVSPLTSIRLTFDRPMNAESTEAAFRLTPALRGRFDWDDTTLIFTPERGYLSENAQYTVTLDTSARSAAGEAVLTEPYVSTFRTMQFEMIASFGEGANLQVLDTAGRRALQFTLKQAQAELITFEMYQLDLPQFLERYAISFHGPYSSEKKPIRTTGLPLIRQWSLAGAPAPLRTQTELYVQEMAVPADVPPGLYVLNLNAGRVNDQLFVVLARSGLVVRQAQGQLTTWLTAWQGSPASSATVQVYGRDGAVIAEGQTNPSGVYQVVLPSGVQPMLVVARQGDDLIVAGLSSEWNTSGGYGTGPVVQPRYALYLYTDRNLYLPGQEVYVKGLIRQDDDAVLDMVPENTPVILRLLDAEGKTVQTLSLGTNSFGAVDGRFTLSHQAHAGGYSVELSVGDETYRQRIRVQAKDQARGAVTVTTDSAAYVAGEAVRVTVAARDQAGQPMPDQQIILKRFQRGRAMMCDPNCAAGLTWYENATGLPQLYGRTDSSGRATFELSAFTVNDLYYAEPGDFVESVLGLEATVGEGDQTASSFTAFTVFSVGERIRLDTGGYVQMQDQPFTVQTGVTALSGTPVSNRALTLEVRRWNVEDYNYTTVVQARRLKTDANGQANTALAVSAPGFYQILVQSRDARGNEIRETMGLMVVNPAEPWAGRANNSADLTVAVDRDTYWPGETARVTINSSFSGPALLTVERGSTRRIQVITLTAPLTQVDVPIQREDAPNVFITISGWKLQADKLTAETWTSLRDRALRTATVQIRVPVLDKRLNVTITPDKDHYVPGESATFVVKVTNTRGEPVSAEVSFALVEQAAAQLSQPLSKPVFDAVYHERGLAASGYDSFAPWRDLLGWGGRCGCGGDGYVPEGFPHLSEPATAAWIPAFRTDWKGEATLTLPLPKSAAIGVWRAVVVAATADAQVGEGWVDVATAR
jgi:hypothetical protein